MPKDLKIDAAHAVPDQNGYPVEYLPVILESMPEGILGINGKRIVFANQIAADLLGQRLDVLPGMVFSDFFQKMHRTQVSLFIRNPSTEPLEIGHQSPVILNSREVRLKKVPLGPASDNMLLLIKDITDQVRMERQLRQSQKMEAIGTLAGGIAHDFNNILAAIMGYAEIAKYDIDAGNPAQYKIDQILMASTRARDLIYQILAFSRQSEYKPKPVQMHLIVKEALQLIRASLPSSIEIHHQIKTKSSHVMADATQIHQVLMNLCANARFAMRENGGRLDIRLETCCFEDADSMTHFAGDLQPGAYLKLTVADTGVGMDPAVAERIFEPYFTTKRKGEGTGMGMAVVHGIVKGHGGKVTVDSTPGKGTVFCVYLPQVNMESREAVDESRPLPTGTESILFVDDEAVLVNLGRQMLALLGYQVECRTSSVEALEAFRANPEKFDLVITDMTMPNMNGDRLTRALMEIRPDLPVLMCTGFSERITVDKAKNIGARDLLMKPLALNDLARIVRRTLDSRGGNG